MRLDAQDLQTESRLTFGYKNAFKYIQKQLNRGVGLSFKSFSLLVPQSFPDRQLEGGQGKHLSLNSSNIAWEPCDYQQSYHMRSPRVQNKSSYNPTASLNLFII